MNSLCKFLIVLVFLCPGCTSEDESDHNSGPVLKYLGTYERDPRVMTDHLMGLAVLDNERLLVASSYQLVAIDRVALESDQQVSVLGEGYQCQNNDRPTNLDGQPMGLYFHKFFHVVAANGFVYASTRFDETYVFRIQGESSQTVLEFETGLLTPRQFTEDLEIFQNQLFAAHHADGVAIYDLSDPALPVLSSQFAEGLVDAWGVLPEADGVLWVADGAGGIKKLQHNQDGLELIAGDDVNTSPGVCFDLDRTGDFVLAACGGQGVQVYRASDAERQGGLSLPGVCVDVATMNGGRAAVVCRSWLHVVDVDDAGVPHLQASARLHRRMTPQDPSTHIGSGVATDGDRIYVAGWDHVDAYNFVFNDEERDADIQLTSQRFHFGEAGTKTTNLRNSGQGVLNILAVNSNAPDHVHCEVQPERVDPGQEAVLTVHYDGAEDLSALCEIISNDPNDTAAPIQVYGRLAGIMDPGETALDFGGSLVTRNYADGSFDTSQSFSLADYAAGDQAVHFAIFGSW